VASLKIRRMLRAYEKHTRCRQGTQAEDKAESLPVSIRVRMFAEGRKKQLFRKAVNRIIEKLTSGESPFEG